MSAPRPRSDALTVATALRDLGREERQILQHGRFDDLDSIEARRSELLRELDRELEPGWPAEPAVHAMLELARQEGAENLKLRRLLQPRPVQATSPAAPIWRVNNDGRARGK